MIRIHIRNQGSIRWQHIFHKDEKSLLWVDLDPPPNYIRKLAYSKVIRDQILLFIDSWDVALVCFLDNHLQTSTEKVCLVDSVENEMQRECPCLKASVPECDQDISP